MGLLDLFRKNKASISSARSVETQIAIYEQLGFDIHQDLKDVLWFADGPMKNYERDKEHSHSVKIGEWITLSLVCYGTQEPSLIYLSQPISKPSDHTAIPRPSYYPSYADLSSEQKWTYLRLLENPYDSSADIGYVFILYYGLERHLLTGNFDAAFEMILKLRDVHTNASFQFYSANALVLSSMLKQRADMAWKFAQSLDKEHELNFSDNLYLLCCYNFDIAMEAKDIMRMSKTFEFSNMNYIKNYPNIFEENLKSVMSQNIGAEKISIKEHLKLSDMNKLRCQDTRIYANISLVEKSIQIPMLSENFKLKKIINAFLEDAHEKTKKQLAEKRKAGEIVTPNKTSSTNSKQIQEGKL